MFTLGLPTLSEGSIARTVEDLPWDFLEEILKRLEVEDGLHWVTFSKKMITHYEAAASLTTLPKQVKEE